MASGARGVCPSCKRELQLRARAIARVGDEYGTIWTLPDHDVGRVVDADGARPPAFGEAHLVQPVRCPLSGVDVIPLDDHEFHGGAAGSFAAEGCAECQKIEAPEGD